MVNMNFATIQWIAIHPKLVSAPFACVPSGLRPIGTANVRLTPQLATAYMQRLRLWLPTRTAFLFLFCVRPQLAIAYMQRLRLWLPTSTAIFCSALV